MNNERWARSSVGILLGAMCLVSGCVSSPNGPSDRAIEDDEESDFALQTPGLPESLLTADEVEQFNEGPGRNLKSAAAHGLLAMQSAQDGSRVGTGEGLLIGVWDGGGVLDTHQEFAPSRVTNGSDIGRFHWHATHVAGTLIAKGVDGFEEARGMVPGASIIARNFCGDVSQEIEEAYDTYANLAVTNHSYAEPRREGRYTGISEAFDNLVFDRPEAVLVVAAGNSGCSPDTEYDCVNPAEDGREYKTIDAPGTAKNVISVGSMSDLPYGLEVENIRLLRFDPLSDGDILVEPYSGSGPTADGRIKPDIVANGDRLYSTFTEHPNESVCARATVFPEPISCSSVDAQGEDIGKCYKDNSGTSMATPTVSGIVTVLQGIAINETPLQRLMTAAEVRGLLIHSAESVDSRPKYKFGWGAVSTKNAVEHLRAWSTELDPEQSDHYIKLTEIPERTVWRLERVKDRRNKPVPARITLVWNDLPNDSLLYDLDMVLRTQADRSEILPWTLDPEKPSAPATRARNHVDNVERIDVFDDEYEDETFELELLNVWGAETEAVLLISGFTLER